MSYNYELAMSACLSLKVVEEMIKNTVENQTGKTVSSMKPRYDGTAFDGYDVYFEMQDSIKTVIASAKVNKAFKITEYS